MGTGRSSLPIAPVTKPKIDTSNVLSGNAFKQRLLFMAQSNGYRLKLNDELNNIAFNGSADVRAAILANFGNLSEYKLQIGDKSFISNASIEFTKSLGKNTIANTDSLNQIQVDANKVAESTIFNIVLIHEHTHNLMHHLITKELGYRINTPEFNKAYTDGAIERDIQFKALEAMKRYYRDTLGTPLKANLGVKGAVSLSNMRGYAVHKYSFTESGTYLEVPTVSAEHFYECKYDWGVLRKKYPYAYFVMREIEKRLKK